MRIFVRPYNESFCETWDEFVRCSRKPLFCSGEHLWTIIAIVS